MASITNESTATMALYRTRLADYSNAAVRNGRTVHGAEVQSAHRTPLLTVITVAMNSAKTLRRTVESVLAQSYPNIEYVLIDGGSTDSTLEIIHEYAERLSYWHTGRDRGIGDAFNLGIAASSGEVLCLVNSDDWMGPEQAEVAMAGLAKSRAGFVFGNVRLYAEDGRQIAEMHGDARYRESIRAGMPRVNHPSIAVRRSVYEMVGLFSPRLRIAMDYDWLLRAELMGVHGEYLPELVAHMQSGGACYVNWVGGLREVRDAAIKHGMNPGSVYGRYLWRLVRGHLRELLRSSLPASVVNRIHTAVNPRYRPAPRDTGV